MHKPGERFGHFEQILAQTEKLGGDKKINSVSLETMPKITLAEVVSKYVARVELLLTVSEIIDEELNCRFIDFFELASYCITQIVS